MTQAQQIIQLAKESGERIYVSFEDRSTIKVGDKEFCRVRRQKFWEAIHGDGSFDTSNVHSSSGYSYGGAYYTSTSGIITRKKIPSENV